jgi:putative hydrolase of the HAD superfamily
MSAPRGLLLDFGSVISVSVFERHRETEAALGLRAGCLGWLGPIAPETDALWQAMQRDELTERDYWARRAAELGAAVGEPGWDVQTMMLRVRQTDPAAVVRPEMRQLIAAARARGLRLGILSNELELFYGAEFLGRMGIVDDFNAVVDATHTGVLKPDPRAYAQAIGQLRLAADEILFVDDQFRNIAGAVKAGLQTQFFELRDIPGSFAAIRARLRLAPEQRSIP